MAELPIPRERKLHLSGGVNTDSILPLNSTILDINDHDNHLVKLYSIYGIVYNPKPIELYINSYGGDVYSALGLVSIMEKSNTPVFTYATGMAMSAGYLILIHGHRRFAYEHTTILYHQVSSWTKGKVADMVDDVKQSKEVQRLMEKLTLRKTKIPKEELKAVYKQRRDWFITSKEALKLGIVDEIL